MRSLLGCFLILTLLGCGKVAPYYGETLTSDSKKVESTTDKEQLESQGYTCHREILAQPEEECREVLAGRLCSPGKVKDGAWICSKSPSISSSPTP